MVYLVIIFSMLILILLLRLFIKKLVPLLIVTAVIVGGVYLIYNQTQTKEVQDVYAELYEEENTIDEVTIFDRRDDGSERFVTLTDQQVIDSILADLSDVEVKLRQGERKEAFRVSFDVTEPTSNGSQMAFKSLRVSEESIGIHKVLSDTSHMKTLNSLAEDENVNWQQP
ncbi:hypothetical protein LCM20_01590 [Halobacillus litoralis]|uniref:hypothetical protein n=1 Tax=Halobacillus litoralis TaxID=45668 RepID=UPI001CD45FC1|nr:hypothetical protein [Halobacillus litoralis]MCA0969279.1 hypothetical protein [Halobacillus litoralis]